MIVEQKADLKEFKDFEKSMAKGRAESVFEDMKILFDSTVKQFENKINYERNEVAKSYEKIVQKQKSMILGFEMKYSNLIKGRLDRLESFMDDLALEQARINTRAGGAMISNAHHTTINQTYEDSKFDDIGLFPSEATARHRENNNDTVLGGTASIFDS